MRARALSLIALAALVAVATVAAPRADAQVAVGPPLNQPAATGEGCELGILPPLRQTVPIPPSCTLFGSDLAGRWTTQVPRGNWRVTQANVRTGPRVGPMRITIVQALRSQALGPNGEPSGIICCTSPISSQVFTPPPNTVSSIPVNLPVRNTVTLIDNEPVEVVDYLAISVLTLGSSLPLAADQSTTTQLFYPAIPPGGQQLPGPAVPGAFPLVSAVVCPVAATASLNDLRATQLTPCATVPGPGGPPSSGPPPAPGGAATAGLPGTLRQVGIAGAPRRAAIPVECGAGTGRCRGTVQAVTVQRLPLGARTARRIPIRARAFNVAPGATGAATLVLPAAARRQLARGRPLPVTVTIRPRGGSVARSRVVLRTLPPTTRATRPGATPVLLDMPAQAVASRPAVVQLRLGRTIAARASVRSRPGRVVPAVLRLTPAARARLARAGRLRMTLRAVHRDATGRAVVRTRPVTVLAPRR